MSAQATNYRLKVINNSSNYADFCVYQQDPDLGVPDVQSLAWFAKPLFPTTVATFTWTIDYSFVWSETGELKPGVLFEASQVWPADPSNPADSQVLFSYLDEAYSFEHGVAVPTPKPGSLYIREQPTIPLKQASVGVGMAGSGTFAVQAQPNSLLTFTPHPAYWVTAGTFEQGEVLDIGSILGDSAEIQFPPGVYNMTAILNLDNTWTVKPTSQVDFPAIKAEHTRRRPQELARARS
jgi:rhizosphere induced protein